MAVKKEHQKLVAELQKQFKKVSTIKDFSIKDVEKKLMTIFQNHFNDKNISLKVEVDKDNSKKFDISGNNEITRDYLNSLSED